MTHWMALAQSLHEVLVKMSAGVQALEGLSGEGGAAFKMAHGRQESSVPYHVGLSTDCLRDLVTRQLAFPQASIPGEKARRTSR